MSLASFTELRRLPRIVSLNFVTEELQLLPVQNKTPVHSSMDSVSVDTKLGDGT